MIAPPKGSNINKRLNESTYDNFAIFNIINSIISKTMGMKSSFDTTHTIMISKVENNLMYWTVF